MTSIINDKKLARSSQEEAKAEELPQILAVVPELVQEGPMTSIASDKALTELEVNYATKLQEQLHCVNKENGLLKQCLEEKEQELRVLESVINQDKALLEEVNCTNNILQQQQQHANEDIERLKKEIQVGRR